MGRLDWNEFELGAGEFAYGSSAGCLAYGLSSCGAGEPRSDLSFLPKIFFILLGEVRDAIADILMFGRKKGGKRMRCTE